MRLIFFLFFVVISYIFYLNYRMMTEDIYQKINNEISVDVKKSVNRVDKISVPILRGADTYIQKYPSIKTQLSYRVHAFYYPWYGDPENDGDWRHWNHKTLPHWVKDIDSRYPHKVHQPPDDIASNFYPSLGPYSSFNQDVIHQHMQMLQKARIGVVSYSWYPKGMSDDNYKAVDDLLPLFLNIANKYNIKVCIHHEPYKGRSVKSIREDIIYLHQKYGKHEAFYRYNGKILIYLYDSYIIPTEEWKKLLLPDGEITVYIIIFF